MDSAETEAPFGAGSWLPERRVIAAAVRLPRPRRGQSPERAAWNQALAEKEAEKEGSKASGPKQRCPGKMCPFLRPLSHSCCCSCIWHPPITEPRALKLHKHPAGTIFQYVFVYRVYSHLLHLGT